VFTAPKGGRLRHNNFYQRLFCPALRHAGLPEQVRFHDLRHTCAALLIAQGAHPKAIQAHLGHSSIQVTMDRYGHLFPDALEHLADRLDAARTQARTDLASAFHEGVVTVALGGCRGVWGRPGTVAWAAG
jgi:integrase